MNTSQSKIIARLERLANFLDASIPLGQTGTRIGIDPILGLLPGIGDAIGGLISSYFIIEAARLGVSRLTLGRMMLNLIVDTLVGSVPLLGDLFDFGFKANQRNLVLIKCAHLREDHNPSKNLISAFFSTVGVALVFSAVLLGALIYLAVRIIMWAAS